MATENDDQEKTEDPTQHRIDEFRKKGQVASSRELASVLILASSFATLGLSLIFIYEKMSLYIEWLYLLKVEKAYSSEFIKVIFQKSLETMLVCIAPVFIVTFLVGILSQVIQIGFIFAPNILEVKFEKINPINGFKRLFSIRSIAEAIKGVFKFVVIIGITYLFFQKRIWSFGGFLQTDLSDSFLYGRDFVLKMGFSILIGLFIIAILDFSWEKFQYRKKLRQSRHQVKEETKEKEGNPEIRQRIRDLQRKAAQNRMMQNVLKADVVVSNPTHISIAIRYDQDAMVAPSVIAKGADQIALKIREVAGKHGIPIIENVKLARTLYKTVKTGENIPRVLYKAVAEVLAFVYKMKSKHKVVFNG